MEELLANLEERVPEVYVLDNLLMKELDVSNSIVIVVHCLTRVMASTLNLISNTNDTPTAITLNPVMSKVSKKRKVT